MGRERRGGLRGEPFGSVVSERQRLHCGFIYLSMAHGIKSSLANENMCTLCRLLKTSSMFNKTPNIFCFVRYHTLLNSKQKFVEDKKYFNVFKF